MSIEINMNEAKETVSFRLDRKSIALVKQIVEEKRSETPNIKDSDVYRTAIENFLSVLYPKSIQSNVNVSDK